MLAALLAVAWLCSAYPDDQLQHSIEQIEGLVGVDNQQAAALGRQALATHTDTDPESRMRLLYSVAGALWRLRDYDSSREYATEMLALARQQQALDYQGKALRTMGNIAYFESRFEESESYYLQALQAHQEAGDPDASVTILTNLGSLMSNMGEYRKSLDYLEQALEINIRLGDSAGLFGAWLNMGNTQYRQGLRAAAMESYLNAARYAEEIDDRRRLGMVWTNVGLIYNALGDFEQAEQAWIRALELHNEYGEIARAAATLGNLGTVAYQRQDFEKALELHTRALELAEESGFRRTVAFNLRELGEVYRNMAQYELARTKLEEALNLFTEIDAGVDIIVTRKRLATIDLDTGEPGRAVAALENIVSELLEHDAKPNAIRGQEVLSRALRDLGEYEQALVAYEQFKQWSDELAVEQRQGRVEVLRTQFELEQREQEIEGLNREREIGSLRLQQQELQLERQRMMWYAAVVGIVAMVVIVVLLWRGYLVKQRLAGRLREISITDPLTGAYNRRYALDVGNRELQRALRHDQEIAACMFDIDKFKPINDSYGHAAGDEVLQALVDRCRKELRETDILVRWGGEEFLVLLPMSDVEGAEIAGERLRNAVGLIPFRIEGVSEPIEVTISTGISVRNGRKISIGQLIDEADVALYQAKQAGRNCVRIHAGNMSLPAASPGFATTDQFK